MNKSKKRSVKEIFEAQFALKERMIDLNELAKNEKREFTDGERLEFQRCEQEIRLFEAEARMAYEELPEEKKRAVDLVSEKMRGIATSKAQVGQIEIRAAGDPTVQNDVNAITDDVVRELMEPLQAALLIDKLGVKMNTGVVGTVKYPSVNNVEATLMGETVEIVGKKLEFTEVTAEKRRVGIAIPFSYLSLAQANRDLIAYAFKLVNQSAAQLLNKWMFVTERLPSGSDGVFVKAATEKVFELEDDAITYKHVVALETKVLDKNLANDGTGAYVVTPKVAGLLKTTERSTGTGKYLLEGGVMNGYPVLVSNHVPAGGIGFGFFSGVEIDEYAGRIIEIDKTPKKGIAEVVFNGFYEITVTRPEAFAYGTVTIA